MHISLASDHAGFEEKQHIRDYLISKGHTVLDRGPSNDERVDYPDFAVLVAEDVVAATVEYGILICGTGIGMAMAANKVRGIRAANVTTPEFAALSREHNDANILCLSARFVDRETNERIVDSFLSTPFAGGRHVNRVTKVDQIIS